MKKLGLFGFGLLWLLVLLISLVWHFPASWVLSQPTVAQQLPPALKLKAVQGPWWQGKMQLSWEDTHLKKSLGQVQWQLAWGELLSGNVGMTLHWKQHKQSAQAYVSSNGETLWVRNLNLSADLSQWISLIPQYGGLLSEAKGQTSVKQLNAQLDLRKNPPWPSALSGEVQLKRLDAMGAQVPLVVLRPEVKQNQIVLKLSGGGEGWRIQGETRVMQNHQYRSQLGIYADSAQQMPSWVSLILPMKSPNKAESTQSGRW